jgi:hypothetical protein
MELTDKGHECTRFLHYVTNRLSASERGEMENRLLTDQEFSDEVAACEQELIDAYAVRSLNADEMAELQPWIEASTMRMQRVAVARSFLMRKQHALRTWSGKASVLALAACLFFTISLIAIWSPWIRKPTPPQIAQTHPPSSLRPMSAAQPIQSDSRQPDVILLVAERMRGESAKIPTFVLHRGSPLKLEILLATDIGPGYTLKIVPARPGAQPVFEQANLEPQSIHRQRYLSVMLTGVQLDPGTYDAVVSRLGEEHVSSFVLKWQAAR